MAVNINITDGTGSQNILNGSYSVTSSTNGYDNTSISPSSVDIVDGTNTYTFTIAATGTLTLHVSEDGTSSGTAVVGATFVRTDSSGNIYGSSITSDSSGNAVLSNVPWDGTSSPTIYFKQTASDGAHEYSSVVQSTTLTSQTGTIEITNAPPALRTISYTDANYSGLGVTGEITLS